MLNNSFNTTDLNFFNSKNNQTKLQFEQDQLKQKLNSVSFNLGSIKNANVNNFKLEKSN